MIFSGNVVAYKINILDQILDLAKPKRVLYYTGLTNYSKEAKGSNTLEITYIRDFQKMIVPGIIVKYIKRKETMRKCLICTKILPLDVLRAPDWTSILPQ